MAIMNQEGLKCHRTQIGSYNANLMCQFLVEFCQTRRKITIIFDKVRLHKCESVKQIAESHQCNLFIHPPYSSMLNQKFGIYFQSGIQLLNRYREIVSRHGLINSLEVGTRSIRIEDCKGWDTRINECFI